MFIDIGLGNGARDTMEQGIQWSKEYNGARDTMEQGIQWSNAMEQGL
jgi:hypothetical protein